MNIVQSDKLNFQQPSQTIDIVTPVDDLENYAAMSPPGTPVPKQPSTPQLSLNNKRAQLEWQPIENVTSYAVERKRAGDNDNVIRRCRNIYII